MMEKLTKTIQVVETTAPNKKTTTQQMKIETELKTEMMIVKQHQQETK